MNSDIQKILKELFGLQRLGIKVGLEHTEQLLEKIGNPHRYLKFIHIAGTNGKGSTCALINKILKEHGMVVGLYTTEACFNYRNIYRFFKKIIKSHSRSCFKKCCL